MRKRNCGVVAAALMLAACQPTDRDDDLKLNQIQVIGTHNSYHAGLPAGIAQLMRSNDPASVRGLDYAHPPLDRQLSNGVRQIELDIYPDSQGGLYAHPLGVTRVAKAGIAADPAPYAPDVMSRPGFKVLHMQDLDYVSNCQPFRACLEQVRRWSDEHPRHLPIFILIETKRAETDGSWPTSPVESFTTDSFDALEREIGAVFPADRLITPDQVRGSYETLEQAVLAGNWPSLKVARGRLVFLLDQKWNTALYLAGHPGLQGRLMFTNEDPGTADAAFIERNDASADDIADLVRRGYLVRTRADWDTQQARINDIARREAAKLSGAQMLSTDFPMGEPARWTGYHVELPGGAAGRCNPVLLARECRLEP